MMMQVILATRVFFVLVSIVAITMTKTKIWRC